MIKPDQAMRIYGVTRVDRVDILTVNAILIVAPITKNIIAVLAKLTCSLSPCSLFRRFL